MKRKESCLKRIKWSKDKFITTQHVNKQLPSSLSFNLASWTFSFLLLKAGERSEVVPETRHETWLSFLFLTQLCPVSLSSPSYFWRAWWPRDSASTSSASPSTWAVCAAAAKMRRRRARRPTPAASPGRLWQPASSHGKRRRSCHGQLLIDTHTHTLSLSLSKDGLDGVLHRIHNSLFSLFSVSYVCLTLFSHLYSGGVRGHSLVDTPVGPLLFWNAPKLLFPVPAFTCVHNSTANIFSFSFPSFWWDPSLICLCFLPPLDSDVVDKSLWSPSCAGSGHLHICFSHEVTVTFDL